MSLNVGNCHLLKADKIRQVSQSQECRHFVDRALFIAIAQYLKIRASQIPTQKVS
jgi:hypothetical protein